MTKEEYGNLKFGDIITHQTYGGYYIVFQNFSDTWIETQSVQNIGRETEFGFEHDNFEFMYCDVIQDRKLHSLLNKGLKQILGKNENDFGIENRNDFLDGIKWMYNSIENELV